MRTIFIRGTCLSLLTILVLAPVLFPAKIFDKAAKKQLTAYLEEICQWILTREQAARDGQIQSIANTPLSLQGNLARVLLAGGELTKNGAKYLEEGLRLCDAFAERQQRVVTSLGNEGGYWSTGAPGDVDLSENSLAAVALARGFAYADGNRKKTYRQALDRYSAFLLEGARAGNGLQTTITSWQVQGENGGAFGSGIQKGVPFAEAVISCHRRRNRVSVSDLGLVALTRTSVMRHFRPWSGFLRIGGPMERCPTLWQVKSQNRCLSPRCRWPVRPFSRPIICSMTQPLISASVPSSTIPFAE